MTPSALTPAARRTSRTSRKSGSEHTGHRSSLRSGVAPRSPRRVSGPAGGVTRTRPAPARPARSGSARSGSARHSPLRRPFRRAGRPAPTAALPWQERLVARVRALPDHVLLDRMIRGRWWIPLLGVLLAGIVAMQVEVLKLNAATAVSLQRSTSLQNQRDALQASVSQLGDEQRIESLAAKMGMQMPAPANVKFLSPGATSPRAAIANIHAPNAPAFTSALQAEEASTANLEAAAGATQPTSSGTPSTGSVGLGTAPATVTPGTSAAAPTTSTVAPTTSTVAPTTSTVAPTTSTAAPATSAAVPTTSAAVPTTGTTTPYGG